uniref:CSON003225 protein n=1 Tax=Culicoides sonorensis TaxID=179676 RepID=A0A336LSK6_CULSO
MSANILIILIIYGLLISVTNSRNIESPHDQTEIKCESLPENLLVKILGSAYNPRYMSVNVPVITSDHEPQVIGGKRGVAENDPDFYVDDEFQMDLSNKPAWQVNFITETNKNSQKMKRSVSSENLNRKTRNSGNYYRSDKQLQREKPWFCESKIRWHDLGPDYYPRWLRTVECVKHDCWYGKATCKPKSFTVKILKRQQGKCVTAEGLSSLDLPNQEKKPENTHLEVWTWEERAVNFCCDCALVRQTYY